MRRLHENEEGQDILEFVLLLPFMLFFLFVIIDFGIALDRYLVITHAVREGARYGAVGQVETGIRQRSIDQSQGVLSGATSACGTFSATDDKCLDVAWNDGPDTNTTVAHAGDAVAVRARYRYKFLNPFVSWMPFNSIVLGACADSRIEVPPTTAGSTSWSCSS
jgi:Flp pilus assembly protein TadG